MRELTEDEKQSLTVHVEHDTIRLAEERVQATRDRVVQARVNLDAAAAAHEEAQRVSDRAVAGDGDPIEAEKRIEEAARTHTVAQKVFDAAQRAAEEAAAERQRAKAQAWMPVYAEGVRRRIGAAQKADVARAAIAAAEEEHRLGTAIMQHAFAHDVPHPVDSVVWNQPLRTEHDERRIWAAERGPAWIAEDVINRTASNGDAK